MHHGPLVKPKALKALLMDAMLNDAESAEDVREILHALQHKTLITPDNVENIIRYQSDSNFVKALKCLQNTHSLTQENLSAMFQCAENPSNMESMTNTLERAYIAAIFNPTAIRNIVVEHLHSLAAAQHPLILTM